MKKYENPKMKVNTFSREAVLAASGNVLSQLDEWKGSDGNKAVATIDFGDLKIITF